MKKRVKVIIIAILAFLLFCVASIIIFYNNSLTSTGSSDEEVILVVKSGMTSKEIVDSIYNANLIKNKYCGYVYLKLHNESTLQAGSYSLNKGMNFKEIINTISSGKIIDDSITITFVEGKRVTTYFEQISKTFGFTKEELETKLNNKEYLQSLIDKYWFLTNDILNDNIYYALEGYLYPNTYAFAKDSKIEDIVEKMLNNTNTQLEKYKDKFTNNNYSIHEIITMASIIELEGSNSDDRAGVAGVFYNRLNSGWSLGSDVTTYYGAKIEMSERDLYQYEIEDINPYNTRPAIMAGKLPIGPICNPSIASIEAALNPEEHDFYFFVADKNKKTYFTKTNSEHLEIINKLKTEGLWFEYK